MLANTSSKKILHRLLNFIDFVNSLTMEQLNHFFFTIINATPSSSVVMIMFASMVAKYVIFIIPLLLVGLWLWGPSDRIVLLRQLLVKTALALIFALCVAYLIGHLFPSDRPFVKNFGYTFLFHAPNNAFPSNHGSAIFTFALAFLFWHRLWSGISLMIVALAIAWSRIYLGLHWPLDMLGAFFVGLISCFLSQQGWCLWGNSIMRRLLRFYRYCFASLIRKGWVNN
ncbi:putative undecaprenyl-diphosphatase ybjG [Candidatus Regiella insecticola]|uniref:undecaprenyl-diphosphate phosphatase n=2 Tax=Candidatus Regiella insecticola TaxID=138073 RepID=A0A6L2ZLI2_9ENTR|nr:putative undecaprenyl-diphosphatase ybjG [Candidatus Regiella insecticola]